MDSDCYYYSDGDSDKECYTTLAVDDDSRRESNYTVLTEFDIRRRQNDDVSHISSVLSLSPSEATTLLCRYNWKVSKLHDDWFADEDAVRTDSGLLTLPPGAVRLNGRQCQICFDEEEDTLTANCEHPYCVSCWRTYVVMAITDSGPGCLSLRCPDPGCRAAVGLDLIGRLGLEREYMERYEGFLVRSYVEGKRDKIKWCPSPGCDNAVDFELDGGDVYDVKCLCSNEFCWNCCQERHRPVDCKTVDMWMKKNSSESENTNWILAFSKPCPKCKRPIEKNNGCNHMTCSQPCRYEFCWLCLEDWKSHRTCNGYNNGAEDGDWKDEDERRREMAKKSIQRYTHYYERWASNNKSRMKAIEDLNQMKSTHLKVLCDKLKESEKQLSFILEAWKQIIECRRVLKWTYAYGFYLDENEHSKLQLFEYSQGEAEAGLERLHHCVERELSESYIFAEIGDVQRTEFNQFSSKLKNLTRVTCSYFENLVRDLENGLAEVKSTPQPKPLAFGKPKGQKRKAGSTSASLQPIDGVIQDDVGF